METTVRTREERKERKESTRPVSFGDVGHTRHFLRSFLGDRLTMVQLRHALLREGAVGDLSRLSDHQVVDLIASRLASGRLHVRRVITPRAGVGNVPPVEAEPEEQIAPTPASVEDRTTFIKFELVDMEGAPIAGERYRITLPNGEVKEGRLDSRGSVRLPDQEYGKLVEITFPDLDTEAWEAA